ncbi:adenosine 3'-phospho 5'-phosphosulfate transporter 2-like [Amphiura filiformis]|uniref:adenosine 3'-phospho 5'-phosphosulfate transporter 2-like n=1 Tax=Amphiura filiformis TaxID=82378 RepID=UPI003B219A33
MFFHFKRPLKMAVTNTAIYAFSHHGTRPLTSKSFGSRGTNIDSNKLKLAADYLMDPEHKEPNLESKLKTQQHVVDISSSEYEKQAKSEATLDKLYVVGLPVYKWTKPVQFIVCVGGVFFFYLIYGYMQELIFRLEGFKPFGWYLTLIQFASYIVFGVTEKKLKEPAERRIPLKTYAILAFLTVATMGLSNSAVGYLNYPTQVIFKCCKLIPVMIGGVLIQNKRFNIIDVIAAMCMSVGLIFFILADSTVSPNFDQRGIIMISLALCADAVIGNVQEKAMKSHHASNTEVVLYSYGIGFIYIFIGLLLHGSLLSAFRFCYQYPLETYGYAVIFSITGYLGIMFVLSLIRLFGALLAVTVTTCRKAVTIILSFLFFTKPFTQQYIWSGILVLLGIFFNVYSKNQRKIDDMIANKIRQIIILIQQRGHRMQRHDSRQMFDV